MTSNGTILFHHLPGPDRAAGDKAPDGSPAGNDTSSRTLSHQASMVRSSGPVRASARHKHASLTLGTVISGKRALRLQEAILYAGPGDILCIAPGCVHSCPDIGPCEHLTFSIPASLLGQLGFTRALPGGEASVFHDPGLSRQLLELSDMVVGTGTHLACQSLLISILADILSKAHEQEACSDNVPGRCPDSGRFAEVAEHLKQHLDENLRLEELAERAGLSPCRFNRTFARELGMPPHQYLSYLRTREARHLITQGMSLAEAAVQCGFSDQSHMNRVFLKILGMTPGQYARAWREPEC